MSSLYAMCLSQQCAHVIRRTINIYVSITTAVIGYDYTIIVSKFSGKKKAIKNTDEMIIINTYLHTAAAEVAAVDTYRTRLNTVKESTYTRDVNVNISEIRFIDVTYARQSKRSVPNEFW